MTVREPPPSATPSATTLLIRRKALLVADYKPKAKDAENDLDERLSIPLEPEEALRALLKVEPDADLAPRPPKESPDKEAAS